MEFLNRIRAILNKPFPEDESRFGAPKVILLVSLFVVFFLYVFKPFGISTLESNQFLICLGFGGATFVSTVVYEFIVGQLLRLKGEREQWTFGKWIVNNLGIMFAISLGNFLYARLVLFGYMDWSLFPQMIYATLMIGIIPVVALGAWSLMRQEKKYQDIAAQMNLTEQDSSSFNNSVERSIFDIPLHQLKFVEALQNYVQLTFINAAGDLTTQTERATLKHLLSEMEGSPIVRCHRSFLVNREAITSIEGNAQGLLLTLTDCDQRVPVSRTYVDAFRNG